MLPSVYLLHGMSESQQFSLCARSSDCFLLCNMSIYEILKQLEKKIFKASLNRHVIIKCCITDADEDLLLRNMCREFYSQCFCDIEINNYLICSYKIM